MPVGFGGQSQQRWGDNTLNANEYMRDFSLMDTGGEPRQTAAARKKGPVVLAFFKTGCPTCQMTLPYLQKVADAYADSGKLTVWGVSQDDGAKTEAFASQYGIKFPLLLDHDLYHSMVYGLTHVPTIVFADSTGRVRKKIVGWNRAGMNDLSTQIAALLEVEPVAIVNDADTVAAVRPG